MSGVVAEVGSTANHYQILARLATGGMAEIFLARGISTTGVERYCVLKRILRERATDVQFVSMFLDEARLVSQLQHPNVAQVYDIGKLGDSYFFTMEYVHGETVRALLHRARSQGRAIPPGAVMTIIAGSAAGLHHAHDRLGHDGRPLGIVHRDVSPSNLMLSYEGGVKVVDFGVAKAENRSQQTRSGTVKGKIAYLSPEQCRGSAIDRRSDLFSLGIVMWEMLTTERLYKRASDFDNMTAIVSEEPVPPSSRNPAVPPELDSIAMRLLAKDPAARFQTGDELVEALEGAASRVGLMLSSGALSRFLRELFGQRPEPWLELAASTQPAPLEGGGGVTVTSEPIPNDLVVAALDESDELALSGVIDLRAAHSASASLSEGVPRPAAPLSSQLTTAQQSPTLRNGSVDVGDLTAATLRAPPAVEHAAGARPTSSSSSDRSGSSKALPAARVDDRRWPLIAIVAAAAVIGSLTVWAVMRSDDAAVIASVPLDALVAASERDGSESAAATEVAHDAAEVALVFDAPGPEPVTHDAAPVRDALAVAMDEQRYSDVVAACEVEVKAQHASSCTLAACQLRHEPQARRWFPRVTAGRRSVVTACRALGIDLVPKVRAPRDAGVTDPCAANPMACQN